MRKIAVNTYEKRPMGSVYVCKNKRNSPRCPYRLSGK